MGMMNDFAIWKGKLKKAMSESLSEDVRQSVEKDFQEVAQSEIYGSYSPILYERRWGAGGIYDISNIQTRVIGSKMLIMENIAPANTNDSQGLNAVGWVESDRGVPGARPYHSVVEAKAMSGSAQKAFVSGVKKRM